jgi:hypothetical protein
VKVQLLPPRTISRPVGSHGSLVPWVEVTLRLALRVAEWAVDEVAFFHWAAPWSPGARGLAWRRFDPGRRAASPGAPEGEEQALTQEDAASLAQEVAALLPRELYFQPALGVVSVLGESFSAFRHRCLKLFAPRVQEGLLRRELEAARAVAAVVEGIQRRSLGPEELVCLEARVGLGYYPAELAPSEAPGELMVEGGKGFRG